MVRSKKIKTKCKVNGCLTNTEEGICKKCSKSLNSKKLKRKSELSYPKALREAKASFQKLRRLQEADKNGVCKCVNGEYRRWDKCDGGHYIPAIKLYTCFNPMNVNPQSGYANMSMNNPTVAMEYREYLIDKHGLEAVERLEKEQYIQKKYSVFELQQMKAEYDRLIEIELLRIKAK